MKTYKIILTPYGSLTSFPDSQTLFGAICWSIREFYGEEDLEELLDNFLNHKNRFLVSSSFVEGLVKAPITSWAKLDEIIQIGKRLGIESSQLAIRSKDLKKVDYFSESVFRAYLKGEVDRREVVEDIISQDGHYQLKTGILHYNGEDLPSLDYYVDNSRRNFINRLSGSTNEGQLFYYRRMYMFPDTRLYFLIKTKNIDYFTPIFNYMSDIGLGGDKSIGVNNYRLSLASSFDYEKTIDENILVSKYIPYYDEVNWDENLFNVMTNQSKIESRHDFMGHNPTKTQIGCLVEGSKIAFKQDKETYGRLPVVKEIGDRKIRHNGLGFFI
jgi:CRISPR-associated protein Csm4